MILKINDQNYRYKLKLIESNGEDLIIEEEFFLLNKTDNNYEKTKEVIFKKIYNQEFQISKQINEAFNEKIMHLNKNIKSSVISII